MLAMSEDMCVSSTATTVADSPPEPVVVFACRHLYHRRCVLDAISVIMVSVRTGHTTTIAMLAMSEDMCVSMRTARI
jgi:hypothetical protein